MTDSSSQVSKGRSFKELGLDDFSEIIAGVQDCSIGCQHCKLMLEQLKNNMLEI